MEDQPSSDKNTFNLEQLSEYDEAGELTRFGPFVVSSTLGDGYHSLVYEIEDSEGTKYALKLYKNPTFDFKHSKFESRITRFGLFCHPNILQPLLFHSEQIDGYTQFLYEICPVLSNTLLDIIGPENPFTIHDTSKLVEQVGSALVFLHEELNTVHGDPQPKNIGVLNGSYVLFDYTDMAIPKGGIESDPSLRIEEIASFIDIIKWLLCKEKLDRISQEGELVNEVFRDARNNFYRLLFREDKTTVDTSLNDLFRDLYEDESIVDTFPWNLNCSMTEMPDTSKIVEGVLRSLQRLANGKAE